MVTFFLKSYIFCLYFILNFHVWIQCGYGSTELVFLCGLVWFGNDQTGFRQAELGGGTSWHATGLMGILKPSTIETKIAIISRNLYRYKNEHYFPPAKLALFLSFLRQFQETQLISCSNFSFSVTLCFCLLALLSVSHITYMKKQNKNYNFYKKVENVTFSHLLYCIYKLVIVIQQ